ILHSLRVSRDVVAAATSDLSADEWMVFPVHGGNPAAYIVCHLTMVDRMALTNLEVPLLPDVPADFTKKFARGATPPREPEVYGDATRLFPRFLAHRSLLMSAIQNMPEATFAAPAKETFTPPFPMFRTVGERLNFLGLHTQMHAGQLTMLRRSLGRP